MSQNSNCKNESLFSVSFFFSFSCSVVIYNRNLLPNLSGILINQDLWFITGTGEIMVMSISLMRN